MDRIDAQLLDLLQHDCTQSYANLAEQVGLSVTPVVERLKKLRSRGHIRAHVALVDPRSLGLHICAFVGVLVERPAIEAAFIRRMASLPEVQECHVTSGEYPILLKMRVTDARELEQFVNERVKATKGVLRVRIEIALATYKETQVVPVHAG
jgi:Lrp/AsnC family transcriptional regulator, leucine-responsive regulatory protein